MEASNGSAQRTVEVEFQPLVETTEVHVCMWAVREDEQGQRVIGFLLPNGREYKFSLPQEQAQKMGRQLLAPSVALPE